MIRLQRVSPPPELTSNVAAELTQKYKDSGDSVWNQPYIRDTLLRMSHGKCAYCESYINEESKYMEVEHFHAKAFYPDQVVKWNNLLPACKRCNVRKSNHDVLLDGMIVDPTLNDPKRHLRLHFYRIKGKDQIGRQTVEAVYLNDTDRLVSVRMKIGEAIMDALSKIRVDLEAHLAGAKTRHAINRATRSLEKLFLTVRPEKEYSAIAATILLADDDYDWIRSSLTSLGLWSTFIELEIRAKDIALT